MVLWSVALGMGIGILYGAASLLGVRLSKGRNVQQFTTIILGGMFIRIVVAICTIAVIFKGGVGCDDGHLSCGWFVQWFGH